MKYEIAIFHQDDDGAGDENGHCMDAGYYWNWREVYEDGSHGPWHVSSGPYSTMKAAKAAAVVRGRSQ